MTLSLTFGEYMTAGEMISFNYGDAKLKCSFE